MTFGAERFLFESDEPAKKSIPNLKKVREHDSTASFAARREGKNNACGRRRIGPDLEN
jgi:hypothetical protein